jgi:site-specific DNA-methyltransferase (adenine-specific)
VIPYYEQDGVTIYHGDCREVLLGLVEEPDLVLADPPYGMNNNCDYTRFTMGPNGHGAAASRRHAPVHGDDEPFDPTPWLRFNRVVLWGWNHFAARLPVGTTLVWIKRLDGGFGSFLSDGELAWMKGGHGVYMHRDTSLFGETNKRRHPTEKPVGLMRWCIEKAGGDGLILDPYMGSGTTLRAAKDLGRRAIGIELEERYCEIAAKRLQQSVLPLEVA